MDIGLAHFFKPKQKSIMTAKKEKINGRKNEQNGLAGKIENDQKQQPLGQKVSDISARNLLLRYNAPFLITKDLYSTRG